MWSWRGLVWEEEGDEWRGRGEGFQNKRSVWCWVRCVVCGVVRGGVRTGRIRGWSYQLGVLRVGRSVRDTGVCCVGLQLIPGSLVR